jgi:hypothetical protein
LNISVHAPVAKARVLEFYSRLWPDWLTAARHILQGRHISTAERRVPKTWQPKQLPIANSGALCTVERTARKPPISCMGTHYVYSHVFMARFVDVSRKYQLLLSVETCIPRPYSKPVLPQPQRQIVHFNLIQYAKETSMYLLTELAHIRLHVRGAGNSTVNCKPKKVCRQVLARLYFRHFRWARKLPSSL